jgi:hypothetical protein
MARAPNGGVAMACGTAACLVLLLALAGATGARGAPAPATASNATPSPLIPLATPLGQALLATSWQAADFGPLAQAFLTQENLAYCGVASAVMALNSLGVAAPIAEGVGPYHYWSQINCEAAPARMQGRARCVDTPWAALHADLAWPMHQQGAEAATALGQPNDVILHYG